MNTTHKPSVIGLGVENLNTSYDFYKNTLGWTTESKVEDGIVFFFFNGIIVSLYPREKLAEDARIPPEGSGFSGISLAINCANEAEVDNLFQRIGHSGGKIIKRPEKVFWGGYSGYFCDPDQHLWEVAHNPFWEFEPNGNIKKPNPSTK